MIKNKHFNKIVIGLVIAAVVFTGVFMFDPGLLGIRAVATNPEYQTAMFDKDAVTSIGIKITDKNWKKLIDDPLAETFVPCDITINGKTFSTVGIRTKGNSSLNSVANSDSDRFSFKIKADEYVKGQSFFGLDEFVINNMQSDASYMKEYLSYDMFDKIGVATPLYAYAGISVNGTYKGLYLAVEAMEEDYAVRTQGRDHGELYKPESAGIGGGAQPQGDKNNLKTMNTTAAAVSSKGAAPQGGGQMAPPNGKQMGGPPDGNNTSGAAMGLANGGQMPGMGGSGGGSDLVYTDDKTKSYSQIFDNAVFDVNTKDSDRVIKALKNLGAGTDLETYVDVKEVLRYFAANTALTNLDSYVSSLKHNYYLYEKDGMISILPWDLNLSFGGFQAGSASAAINFPIDTPVTGVKLSERPLIGKLLEVKEYKKLYHQYLNEIVTDYFKNGYFTKTIDKLDTLIAPYVKDDPTAFYTYAQYNKAVKTLKTYGELRAESIKGQLEGTVPSTTKAQAADSTALINASSITLSDLGSQGFGANRNGMGGGRFDQPQK